MMFIRVRLAGAGRAHDRHVLAALDDEVDAGKGVDRGLTLAVRLGHAGQVDDRTSAARSLTQPPAEPATREGEAATAVGTRGQRRRGHLRTGRS